ncbi:AAA family ATPase [Aeromonas sp. R4-3]|uniref:AAA family ATPase n=2 Tax=Aeromonadaceae TaxID=84642 RepID=UPI0034A10B54
MLEIKHKLAALLAQLNEGLVERDEAMKLALLSLLAGENILLVGPPGTAKSLISRQVAKALKDDDKEGASHFEYLLTKFSTPEEIFGPLSISKLKEDRFERNTAGYLPSVKIAFLDEIFKASSSILNALLTILNERIYHNGASVQKVPLRSLIAASNELPTGQEELGALYDRFLLRSFVDYVSEDNLHKLFTLGNSEHLEHLTPLTLGELAELDKQATSVKLPELIQKTILDIWKKHNELFKEDRREGLSDRRLVKVIHLLKLSALTNDRDEVDLSDLMLLRYCLWNHLDNIGKINTVINQALNKVSHSYSMNEIVYFSADDTNHRNSKNIISGLSGAGTENDPIIISTAEDLFMLTAPEVGKQGYNFKQNANIDISDAWFTVEFKGHYDGHGYMLKGQNENEAFFEKILDGSTVKYLKLSGCSLAKKVHDSTIQGCETDQHMIFGSALRGRFLDCIVTGSLVTNELIECDVLRCKILAPSLGDDYPKLGEIVKNSNIEDCDVIFNYCEPKSLLCMGYMANKMLDSSISRSFIEGGVDIVVNPIFMFINSSYKSDYDVGFSNTYATSKISCCALGKIEHLQGGKIYGFSKDDTKKIELKNNVSIEQTNIYNRIDDANSKDGKKIPLQFFNKMYFEKRLGWNFDNVWVWDEQTNRPTLQSVGLKAANNPIGEQTPASGKIDLLVQQMNANLWV